MTAASYASVLNPGAIWAVIRKDARLFWPFALALGLAQFLLTALFFDKDFYPAVMLEFGDAQLHVDRAIELFHTVGMPIVIAIFIAVLVHADPAHDARHDWMSRPISPLDIVLAKALSVIAVVLLPLVLGIIVYVTTREAVTQTELVITLFLTVIGSTFMLLVAWLSSSPVQALLAPFGLVILAMAAALTLGGPLGLAIESDSIRQVQLERPLPARDLEAAAASRRAPPAAPAPPPTPPAVELPAAAPDPATAPSGPGAAQDQPAIARRGAQDRTAPIAGTVTFLEGRIRSESGAIVVGWTLLTVQFLLAYAAAGVVLWLLLARRRLVLARFTFLGFFLAAVLLLMLQSSVVPPRNGFGEFRSVASVRPSAPEPQRMAAFAANDRNSDQRLDKTEYAAVLEELGFSSQFDDLWMQRDDNMDGFISAQEYRAAIPSVPGGRPPAPDLMRFAAFTKHDVDKDNRLSETEYRAVITELGFGDDFATLWPQRDGNQDGFVSAEEYGMPRQ